MSDTKPTRPEISASKQQESPDGYILASAAVVGALSVALVQTFSLEISTTAAFFGGFVLGALVLLGVEAYHVPSRAPLTSMTHVKCPICESDLAVTMSAIVKRGALLDSGKEAPTEDRPKPQ